MRFGIHNPSRLFGPDPYRNPALLARMAAGVDIVSGGRLTFGFGAG